MYITPITPFPMHLRMRFAALLLLAGLTPSSCAPAPSTAAGNLWAQSSVLVLRANDAVYSASSSVGAFLDEISSAGVLATSFGPLVGTGPGARGCALSSAYPRDGWAQRSADGKSLTFMAMDVPFNSGWPNTAVSNAKVAVIVYSNGTTKTNTYSIPMYEGGNYYLFTAATNDGTGFWTMGPSLASCDAFAGLRYLPAGSSGTNVLVSPPSLGRCNYDTRFATVFGGSVYASFSDAGVRGVYLMGSVAAATTASTATLLSGFENY